MPRDPNILHISPLCGSIDSGGGRVGTRAFSAPCCGENTPTETNTTRYGAGLTIRCLVASSGGVRGGVVGSALPPMPAPPKPRADRPSADYPRPNRPLSCLVAPKSKRRGVIARGKRNASLLTIRQFSLRACLIPRRRGGY